MADSRPKTRIQARNRAAILEAALEVFSQAGFRGATLDQIATTAGLSKPNVLYYYPSKEAIHVALLSDLMDDWLEPLRALDPEGDAVDEILAYVLRKLDMAREMPRESRLFANEIVQGAPRIMPMITGELKTLVDDKARIIRGWAETGMIAPVDPHHLIFSIWATTQHYADFDTQVRGILAPEGDEHFDGAAAFLDHLYRAALTPLGSAVERAADA
ncbi:TetR family transcriptional regulator C-terminal domain-containing protein [Maritimibacter fusiformis]|uniref:TetR family transcriptional regulator n=1 Tax=Maritimibacter fusiformis TaxID=2603819 RepID=A0A5D0RNP0_9RHOB|nr:TetR family transcriptional regulator C-terminal domain-containing protein [Maritimibacter fusiformis]TYB82485.1 TetR family transcriptional regulator [Maritimibacter fusiformis]